MIVRGEAKRMSTPEEKPERASMKKVIVIRASPRVGGNSDQVARASISMVLVTGRRKGSEQLS